jgi:hypothetical protein
MVLQLFVDGHTTCFGTKDGNLTLKVIEQYSATGCYNIIVSGAWTRHNESDIFMSNSNIFFNSRTVGLQLRGLG